MKMSHNSTSPKPQSRKRRQSKWRAIKEKNGDYRNQRSVPEEDIKEFFIKFRNFHIADLDNTETEHLTARRYCLQQGYSERIVRTWVEKYPQYADDWFKGKEAIGDKREVGMIKRRLAEKSTMYTMHNYLDGWKAADKYHDDRAKEKNDDLSAKLKGLIFEVPELDEGDR